ncbi:MAG: type III-B CRISPR module-associated protein Cmr3 [Promethearchaeota archaeon]
MSIVKIVTRDPLIARDGRPFGIGQGYRMRSLAWFTPSVVAGSFRTLVGKLAGGNFDADLVKKLKNLELAGPLPLVNDELFLPCPADVAVRKKLGSNANLEVFQLKPSPLEEGEFCDLPYNSIDPVMLPEEVKGEFKPHAPPAFWSLGKMADWLIRGAEGFEIPSEDGGNRRIREFIWEIPKETRYHVKIDLERGVVDDQHLFSTTGLAITHPIQMGIRVKARDDLENLIKKLDETHPLGGERRLAKWVNMETNSTWNCPGEIVKALDGKSRIRMVLATPAIFNNGWLPGWLKNEGGELVGTPPLLENSSAGEYKLKLAGACTKRWMAISGWNYERGKVGPKPIRRLVPAGSVYFFEVIEGDSKNIANHTWLEPVSDSEQDRKDGFGCAIWGKW